MKKPVISSVRYFDGNDTVSIWFLELGCGHRRIFRNMSPYPPKEAECPECQMEIEELRFGVEAAE